MATSRSFMFLVSLLVYSVSAQLRSRDTFVSTLFEKVAKDQVLRDQPYKTLRSWQKIKGVYSSNIVLNFHGKFVLAEARRNLRIFDNNMFATAFVTSSLLEAFKYGAAPRPSDKQLILTINLLKDHQDKNKPYNTSTMTFWQQQFNKSTDYWECTPVNLLTRCH